jgi:threonine dehydratase
LVPPYDDPLIVAGQGTIGREIAEDLAAHGLRPDIVFIGASGGGLAAGTALGLKARVPDVSIYTVEPDGFDDTLRSFRSGRRETNGRMSGSICDALMSATPGEVTFPITSALIGQGFSVTDADVGCAVRYAFEELKLVVEPGGAVGLAAMLAGKLDLTGKVVVGVLSGGNVDAALFATLIGT